MNYPYLSSHWTPILSQTWQKKNINNSKEHSKLIFDKYCTIAFSKAPKPQVKIITHVNIYNELNLIVAVVFAMIPKLGRLGPEYKDLVLLLLLYLPRVLNLEDLDPNINTLSDPFALVRGKL